MMGGGMHGFGGLGGFGWPGMILGLVFNIGLIITVVWLIVWLVRRFTSTDHGLREPFGPSGGSAGPIEILQARYARGEIDRDQYHKILAELSN